MRERGVRGVAVRLAAVAAVRPRDDGRERDELLEQRQRVKTLQAGVTEWLNSPPLTTESLKGKVVLVDFWTYSCINCLRAIPYVRAWAEKYKDQGLVVIGVHAPEFAFEKSIGNVKRAIGNLKIKYPVVVDNDAMMYNAIYEYAPVWPRWERLSDVQALLSIEASNVAPEASQTPSLLK